MGEEKEIFNPLAHSPNGHPGQGKPGARNSVMALQERGTANIFNRMYIK